MTALAASNHRIRRLRRLSGRRSTRYAESAFVVEGPVLVAEALDQGADLEAVYVASSARNSPELTDVIEAAEGRSVSVYEVVDGVIDTITDAVTPRPVLAVVALPVHQIETAINASIAASSPLLVLIDVRDPGNVGTIIRAADASGAAGVICCTGTADPYSPKVVRAAAGSVLHLPVVVGLNADQALDAIADADIPTLATVVEAGVAYDAAALFRSHALLMGNEAAGLDPEVLAQVDHTITIPMPGRAESLNVAMTASVLCFEAARQRRAVAALATASGSGGESDWTPWPTDDKVNTP